MKEVRLSRKDLCLPIVPGTETARAAQRTKNRRKKLNVAAWNIRTLNDAEPDRGGGPPRRTALLCEELRRLQIEVAVISETHLLKTEEIVEEGNEIGQKLHILNSGNGTERKQGVAIILSQRFRETVVCWSPISDRLNKVRLRCKGRHVSVVGVYAPTYQRSETEKAGFYSQLQQAIDETPQRDMLIVMGDFNARVGSDSTKWGGTVGRHGTLGSNVQGEALLEFCARNSLVVLNTCFEHPQQHKGTWKQPRSKRWYNIDHIMTRTKDRGVVRDCRTMPSARAWTDHKLLRATLEEIKLKRRRFNPSRRQRYNCHMLRDPDTAARFSEAVGPQEETLGTPDEEWRSLRHRIMTAADLVLGTRRQRTPDWFQDNYQEVSRLIEQKRNAFLNAKNSSSETSIRQYKQARNEAKRRITSLKNGWFMALANQMKGAEQRGDARQLFGGLRCFKMVEHRRVAGRIKDGQGQIVAAPEGVLKVFTEYYKKIAAGGGGTQTTIPDEERRACGREVGVGSADSEGGSEVRRSEARASEVRADEARASEVRVSEVRPSEVSEGGSVEAEQLMDQIGHPPTFQETQAAIQQMRNDKAPGADGIEAEIFKLGGEELQRQLHHLFERVWESEMVPLEWKAGRVIPIYKGKGDRELCENHRGITLLIVAGKIFTKVLAARVKVLVEATVSENQYGFRPARSCIDCIFIMRLLIEKSIEHRQQLHAAFVDIRRAFDTLSRSHIFDTLVRRGAPPKLVRLIRHLHEGTTAQVEMNNEVGGLFHVENGVRQGCTIATLLFVLVMDDIWREMSSEASQLGIRVRVTRDWRIDTARKPLEDLVILSLLLFADDGVMVSQEHQGLAALISAFRPAASARLLDINQDKSKILTVNERLRQQGQLGADSVSEVRVQNEVAMSDEVRQRGEREEREVGVSDEVGPLPFKSTEQFNYLGSVLHKSGKMEAEISNRIGKASRAFGALKRSRFWDHHDIQLKTKKTIYQAIVLPSLLYGAETWTLLEGQQRRIESFHLRCMRAILKIRWTDFVSNQQVRVRFGSRRISSHILEKQLSWLGHVLRSRDTSLTKNVMCGELEEKRPAHGTPKRWRDGVIKHLRKVGVGYDNLVAAAKVRKVAPTDGSQNTPQEERTWRTVVREAVQVKEREEEEKEAKRAATRRQRQLDRGEVICSNGNTLFVCGECGKTFTSRRARTAHERRAHPVEPRPTPSPVACDQCGRVLKSKVGLTLHRRKCGAQR
eukprot:GHVN01070515.1.p1 GENE.GHVN01070515.1~~GHVN01070515.1.p1  ORF type:complete len:1235 (-),score=133.71 GHVN01070515.1:257-3961(-)